MTSAAVASLFGALAFLLGLWAAVSDIRWRKIRNWTVLAFAGCLVVQALVGGGWASLGWGLAHAAVALVVGMVLFRFSVIGAGDAKFYGAAAIGVPLQHGLSLLGWTSVSGLVLLAFMAVAKSTRRARDGTLQLDGPGWTVPYGVAIYLGFVMTVARVAEF